MIRKIIIISIALLIIGNFFFFYSPRTTETLVCCDEFEYYTIANNLALGNGYSIHKDAPYSPTLMREPGYPLLLAFILKFSEESSLFQVQLFNIILALCSAVFLWKIAHYVLPPKVALIPSLLFLLSPRIAHYSWTILSDVLATFLLLAAILSLFYAFKSGKKWFYLLSGGIFGALALTKMLFVFFIPGFVVLVFLVKWLLEKRRLGKSLEPIKKTPRFWFIWLLAGFLFVFSPWLIRNIISFQELSLTVRVGQLLDERTRFYSTTDSYKEFISRTVEDVVPMLKSKNTEKQTEQIQESEPLVVSPYGVVYGLASKNAPAKFFSLLKTGLSEREADKIMIKESLQKIMERPFFYISQLPFEALKFIYPELIPGLFYLTGENLPLKSVIVLGVIILSFIFLFFLGSGVIRLMPKPTVYSLIMFVIILYTATIHLLFYVTPRYSFVIYPLLLIIIVSGFTNSFLLLKRLVPPTILLGAGILNLFFHFIRPFIESLADKISTASTCVSCIPKQFFAIDLSVSILLVILGILWLSWLKYGAIFSRILSKHYSTIIKGLILVLWILFLLSSINRLIAFDEIEHLHSTWHVFRGHLPYVDFFEQHHPFLWYILAPLLYLTGETTSTIFISRLIMFLISLGTFWVIYALTKLIFSRHTALLALLFSSSFVLFLDSMIEIRPDVPQTFFNLLAIYFFFLFFKQKKLKYVFFSAFSVGLAFLFLQKSIYLIIILLLIILYKLFKRHLALKHLLAYILPLFGTILPYYLYLFFSGAFSDYFANNWLVNIFLNGWSSPFLALKLSWAENFILWLFILAGFLKLIKSREYTYKIFGCLALLLFLSTFSFKFPSKQYFSVIFALFTIIAAYGFDKIICKTGLNKQKQLVFLFIVIIIPLFFITANIIPNNREHLEKIRFVLESTEANDYVYESTLKLNIFRNDIDYLWYGVPVFLDAYAKFSPYEYNICKSINKYNPKIIISDNPSSFPCELTEYITTKYPDILIRTE